MTYQPLFDRIEVLLATYPQVLIAIDGDCASGKTTLAAELKRAYDGNVIPMDHFFIRPEQRAEARLAAPGGNVDYERFLVEALTPLRAGAAFTYRPFDCKTGDFGAEIAVSTRPLNIVEGSYSLHPTLADAYHVKVFLRVSPDEQIRRIAARNGEKLLERFKTEWIPMEKRYFAAFDVENQCEFIF